jgi:hypothetical protein
LQSALECARQSIGAGDGADANAETERGRVMLALCATREEAAALLGPDFVPIHESANGQTLSDLSGQLAVIAYPTEADPTFAVFVGAMPEAAA